MRTWFWTGVCLLTAVAGMAVVAMTWTLPAPPDIHLGADTTVISQPLRDDGRIDYVAALKAAYAEGVSPQENGYLVIAKLTPPDAWPHERLPSMTVWSARSPARLEPGG